MTFDDAVGPELLDTTLADKHMATVLPKFVLVTRWQILESLVIDITRSLIRTLKCLQLWQQRWCKIVMIGVHFWL